MQHSTLVATRVIIVSVRVWERKKIHAETRKTVGTVCIVASQLKWVRVTFDLLLK